MLEYMIESFRVTCTEDDRGTRIWRCTCVRYQERLAKYGEGFCEHVAVGIGRATEDGAIKFGYSHPSGSSLSLPARRSAANRNSRHR